MNQIRENENDEVDGHGGVSVVRKPEYCTPSLTLRKETGGKYGGRSILSANYIPLGEMNGVDKLEAGKVEIE